MTRLFTNRGNSALDDAHEGDLPKMRTNFASLLAKLTGNFEEMFLVPAWALVAVPIEKARPKC